MKTIESWFQGEAIHNGVGKWHDEGGTPFTLLCLALACDTVDESARLATIVGELFPERTCDCVATERLIHFNNHPETTRDQIDKIMHEYRMRYGA